LTGKKLDVEQLKWEDELDAAMKREEEEETLRRRVTQLDERWNRLEADEVAILN
jgi:hypothetical protein